MSRYKSLNIEKIKTLSEEIRKSLNDLSEYAGFSEAKLLSDKTILNAVKYNFIVDTQAVIDLLSSYCGKTLLEGS